MITIEVLVAMLILFLVIATSFTNIKFYNIMNEKKLTYEDTYMDVLSLKDKLSETLCQSALKKEGTFNGIHYVASCQKEKELKTFEMGIEPDDPSGNIGNYLIKLYRVTLVLDTKKFDKTYNYYITKAEQLNVE